jgi:UDPglucose 6-dehydrogenase
MRIGVAGAGFVGVVHSAVMANQDNKVILFDVNEQRIKALQDFCEGKSKYLPIKETGLSSLMISAYDKGSLKFTTDAEEAIKDSKVVFSCVGTPDDNGKADLKYVDSVAETFGKILAKYPSYKILVNKSTVPVGTAKRVTEIIKKYYDKEFDVVSNPETLAEGRAVRDATQPKRVIVGTESEKAKEIMFELYSSFFLPRQEKIYFMSPESSELAKYACNTYLATQVVLTNVFANLAKRSGANWRDIIPAVLDDIRIGKFVHPGLGFGGSCFDKDVSQLIHSIKEFGGSSDDLKVLSQVLNQNQHQKLEINRILEDIYGKDLSGKTFGVWGLSFKKDTNDIRQSAALEVIPDLLQRGAKVIAHDPEANEEFEKVISQLKINTSNLTLVKEKYEATKEVDALLVLNDWKTYTRPDYHTLSANMKNKILFDAKDLLHYDDVKESGFDYYSIGRPNIRK